MMKCDLCKEEDFKTVHVIRGGAYCDPCFEKVLTEQDRVDIANHLARQNTGDLSDRSRVVLHNVQGELF